MADLEPEWPQVVTLPDGTRLAWAPIDARSRRDVSRALLRGLLAESPGEGEFREAPVAQRCRACGSATHGPLRLDTPGAPLLGVSYAGGYALAAVAPAGSAEFGIDAEPDTEATRRAVAESLGWGPERQPDTAVTEWTRLEAIAKARGTGLRGDWQHPRAEGLEVVTRTLETPAYPLTVAVARRPAPNR